MHASAQIGTRPCEDYERARREFSWEAVRATLPDVPAGTGSTSPTSRSTPVWPRGAERPSPSAA